MNFCMSLGVGCDCGDAYSLSVCDPYSPRILSPLSTTHLIHTHLSSEGLRLRHCRQDRRLRQPGRRDRVRARREQRRKFLE